MSSYLIAFILTVILEFAILWIFVRQKPQKLLLYTFLINLATHPPALYLYQNLWPNLIAIELIIFLVESILLMLLLGIKYRKALLLSFIANLITAIISLLFFI